MGEREARVRQVRHRVQMLLGIFSARGVLPLELKPAYSVGDLLVQHLDDLEREAEGKGGLDQVLANHFSRLGSIRLRLPEICSRSPPERLLAEKAGGVH
jgi:hypothetical protein